MAVSAAAPTNRRARHSQRSIDVLVHGATGYTGKRVVRHLVSNHPRLNVAICGRNASKLDAVASELGWDEDQKQKSVLVVPDAQQQKKKDSDGGGVDEEGEEETSSSVELVAAFSQAKLLLACAGPYRNCGLSILRAAVEAKCDYLDLCGEPQFFDEALVNFDRLARENGVLAIHAAAFDCVPAELGAALAERALLSLQTTSNNGEEGEEEEQTTTKKVECAGIEIVHTIQNVGTANATTFHAAVDGFHAAANGELTSSRRRVRQSHPEFAETAPPPRPASWPRVPETPGAILPGHHPSLRLRTMKFVGADASAVRSSWRYLRSRVPHHERRGASVPEPRLSVLIGMEDDNALGALKLLAYGAAFTTLARYRWGCDVLHSHPEKFSGGVFTSLGPTEEELERGGFATYVTAYGAEHSATREQSARVRVSGPEPGYVATPRLIVALALTILDAGASDDDDGTGSGSGSNVVVKLAFESGVTLPGALFGDCDRVYERMRKEGVSFDVVDDFQTEHSPV